MRAHFNKGMVFQRSQNVDIFVLDLFHCIGFDRRQSILIRHILRAGEEAVTQLLFVTQIV